MTDVNIAVPSDLTEENIEVLFTSLISLVDGLSRAVMLLAFPH